MNTKPTQESKAVRNAEIEKQAMQDAKNPAFLKETIGAILIAKSVEQMKQFQARASCAYGATGTNFILESLFAFIARQNRASNLKDWEYAAMLAKDYAREFFDCKSPLQYWHWFSSIPDGLFTITRLELLKLIKERNKRANTAKRK